MTKRNEILKMDKATAKEERQLKQLERIIERDNLSFEEFLRENEKKSVEARTLWGYQHMEYLQNCGSSNSFWL